MAPGRSKDGSGKDSDIAELTNFVAANHQLETLETLIAQFNLFDALGMVRSEIRHSEFLAFLLNPRESHGLGDFFLKSLLKRICQNNPNSNLNAIEVDVWDWSDVEIRREWECLDIAIIHEKKRLICWIENKIDSAEHTNQLDRYFKTVDQRFPEFRKLPILLTPDGLIASHDAYISSNYDFIAKLLDDVIAARGQSIAPDVSMALRHYRDMLRRHVVSDSKVAELARDIYKKHSRALELIFEHRPDSQMDLKNYLQLLIQARSEVKEDTSIKTYVRFCSSPWDKLPKFRSGEGWTDSKRLVLFEFKNQPDSLNLHLLIGPGDKRLREKIFSAIRADGEFFKGGRKNLGAKWTTIWKKEFLSKSDFERHEMEGLQTLVAAKWSSFLSNDLPGVDAGLNFPSFRRFGHLIPRRFPTAHPVLAT